MKHKHPNDIIKIVNIHDIWLKIYESIKTNGEFKFFFFSPFSSVDSIMILETFDKPKAWNVQWVAPLWHCLSKGYKCICSIQVI